MTENSVCRRLGLPITLSWLYLFRHRYVIVVRSELPLKTKNVAEQTKAESNTYPHTRSLPKPADRKRELLAVGLSSDLNRKTRKLQN